VNASGVNAQQPDSRCGASWQVVSSTVRDPAAVGETTGRSYSCRLKHACAEAGWRRTGRGTSTTYSSVLLRPIGSKDRRSLAAAVGQAPPLSGRRWGSVATTVGTAGAASRHRACTGAQAAAAAVWPASRAQAWTRCNGHDGDPLAPSAMTRVCGIHITLPIYCIEIISNSRARRS